MKNNIYFIIYIIILILISYKLLDNYRTKNVLSNSKKELIINNLNECFKNGSDNFKNKYINKKNTCNSFDTHCNELFNKHKKINFEIYEICKGVVK